VRTGDPGIDRPEDQDFVSIGYIVKTCGIKGDVKVVSLTDIPDRYTALEKVYVHTSAGEKREYCLREVRKVKGGLRLSFVPALSVSEAEGIVGGYISVPGGEVPRLGEGCYYHFEIIGMDVETTDGKYLGKIVDILSTGSNDVYIVRDRDRDYLIPAIHDVVKEVDTKAKRMVITLIEGLI
jgi:16S rRNA processing protein RimM